MNDNIYYCKLCLQNLQELVNIKINWLFLPLAK